MNKIQVLDTVTIDKIAAGEVVERPYSVVKELVENAIDAGADNITVEIKEGGTSFIRVTDNGSGIPSSQIRDAFLRHATSKIRTIEDLFRIDSLGFRGEALSSICAVAQVEVMTKTKDEMLGVHYTMEGGREISLEQVGLPEGTTIIVKNLFFNTPARRKFLKSNVTEGGYIAELCEHLAMSKPEISFRFLANGQVKFHTSGNGDVKEIIYRIFGRDFIKELLPVNAKTEGMEITGYLGKPSLNRANRNFENCFINGRFVKSSYLYKAIEEGYRSFLMQHKFPFVILYFQIDPAKVDINVHPTKMDIRITDPQQYSDFISSALSKVLKESELIPAMGEENLGNRKPVPPVIPKEQVPEPFEKKRIEKANIQKPNIQKPGSYEPKDSISFLKETVFSESYVTGTVNPLTENNSRISSDKVQKPKNSLPIASEAAVQLNLFEEKILKQEHKDKFRILGQVFQTYWLITYEDKLLFVDQHSAHEKVKFERLYADYRQGKVVTQYLQPPLILQLSSKEEALLLEYAQYFKDLGIVWDDFGDHSIAIRQIPMELYGQNEKNFFREILDELAENMVRKTPDIITQKIISMSCKAAVKGNQSMTAAEMEALLEELFTLENPYHCPHGRPTIISMTKNEMEKKFKRIV
ncbi:MAG: DNA mismatch repair endonuclease MutL [Lachnospiraceae bacterium]|nr:DNA mismatch repair endonuclease MutL [Lachnospiraceae bacterium]